MWLTPRIAWLVVWLFSRVCLSMAVSLLLSLCVSPLFLSSLSLSVSLCLSLSLSVSLGPCLSRFLCSPVSSDHFLSFSLSFFLSLPFYLFRCLILLLSFALTHFLLSHSLIHYAIHTRSLALFVLLSSFPAISLFFPKTLSRPASPSQMFYIIHYVFIVFSLHLPGRSLTQTTMVLTMTRKQRPARLTFPVS